MNLRDEWLPYKNLIGQVILDVGHSTPLTLVKWADWDQKNRNLRTVVNKLNTIHAQYRYFDMEVLAGDKDFITTVVRVSSNITQRVSQEGMLTAICSRNQDVYSHSTFH